MSNTVEAGVALLNEESAAATILTGIVRSLVSDPAQVQVEMLADGDASLMTVHVSAQDLDRVIGSGGRTVRSLRTVLSALGKRSGQRISLDVLARNS